MTKMKGKTMSEIHNEHSGQITARDEIGDVARAANRFINRVQDVVRRMADHG